MAQVAEPQPSKRDTLSSNPSTFKKKKIPLYLKGLNILSCTSSNLFLIQYVTFRSLLYQEFVFIYGVM